MVAYKSLFALTLLSTCYASGVKLLSHSYRQFPNALPGKIVEVNKALDTITGQIQITSNSPYITSSKDLTTLEQAEEDLQIKKFGAMSPDMRNTYSTLNDTQEVEVTVCAKYPSGITYLNKLDHSMEDLEKSSKDILTIQTIRDMRNILRDHGISKIKVSDGSVAICKVNKAMIKELASDINVGSIALHTDESATFRPISILPLMVSTLYTNQNALAASAYNHSTALPPATGGSGVHAATFETGLYPPYLSCWGITPALYDTINELHSNTTFRCLTNAARGAIYYHKQSWNYFYKSEQDYIINNAIQVTSMSISRGGMDNLHPRTAADDEFLKMDDFAYRYPYPVFVTPTSNDGWMYESHWQSYNQVNVGNVMDSAFLHYTIDSTNYATMTRNPEQRYGGGCDRPSNATYTYCSSDREMPYVIAPGIPPYRIQGLVMMDPCINLDISEGTSYSAPTANGIAADIIAASTTMTNWPEKVRAVMILTAENVSGGYWDYTIDGTDGSGVINGSEGVSFASTHTEVSVNSTPVEKGLGVGSISASNWSANLTYNIAIPNPKPAGKHLRLVLTWDSNPVVSNITNALSDLDLFWNGSSYRYSSSYNGNVEVIDVPASETSSSTVYSATIGKITNRIPVGSRTDYFYYALAWEFVKDHAR
jgi:hypothetical protein